MVTIAEPSTSTRPARVRPAGWWFDGLVVAAFAVLTVLLWRRVGLGADLAVRTWSDGHRPGTLYRLARAGNLLGQGGFFTVASGLLALVLAWRWHSVRPILPVVVAFVLTFGTLTPLKQWTDRPAPHAPVAYPEHFGAGGVSYPSGHLVNAFVWYGVLALLLSAWLPPLWRKVIRVAPVAILTVTTVYLSFHWLSDTIAGLLLGLFLDRLMRRISWDTVPLGPVARTGWDRPGSWKPR